MQSGLMIQSRSLQHLLPSLRESMMTRRFAAFSLLELLVVVAIIAMMAGAGVAALGGGGGRGPQGAAAVASSVFNLARTEAILRSAETFVVIDTSPSSENYLRRLSVATNGSRIAQWTTLPSMAYFNETLSTSAGTINLPDGSQTLACKYYKFLPNGQLDGSSLQFVVSPGAIISGNFQESGTNKRYGFKIHKMGKLTFFNDPSEIQ